jgi:hypothetical protein
MSIDYSLVLLKKYADKSWQLLQNKYNALEWFDESPMPTKEELDSLYPVVKYETEYENVSEQRHAAYIAESDPIYFQAQRGGDYTLDDWKAKVAEIDERYPYPLKPAGVE